jgi:hypothetical protein
VASQQAENTTIALQNQALALQMRRSGTLSEESFRLSMGVAQAAIENAAGGKGR